MEDKFKIISDINLNKLCARLYAIRNYRQDDLENKFKENFKYSVDVLFDGKSIIISNFVIENWAPNPLNTTPIIPTPIKTPVN